MFLRKKRYDELLEQKKQLEADVGRLTRERDAVLRSADSDAGVPDVHLSFLFVVTYGRSGSTLLMGLLDSLPGFCIRGENAGVVYDLFQYETKASAARSDWALDERLTSRHAWYGIDEYPSELALVRMRQMVLETLLRPGPDTRVAGFKEIRWHMPKLVEYLHFIDQLFPGARFLLNTRNLDDVAKSKWWRNKPNARADLEAVEHRLRNALADFGDRAFHVHYDSYVRDPSVLRELFEWLEVEYDDEWVKGVLSQPHSSRTNPERQRASSRPLTRP